MPLSIDLCASSAIKKSGLREVSNQAVELASFYKKNLQHWLVKFYYVYRIRLISPSKCERTIDNSTFRLELYNVVLIVNSVYSSTWETMTIHYTMIIITVRIILTIRLIGCHRGIQRISMGHMRWLRGWTGQFTPSPTLLVALIIFSLSNFLYNFTYFKFRVRLNRWTWSGVFVPFKHIIIH